MERSVWSEPFIEDPLGFGELIQHMFPLAFGAPARMRLRLPRDVIDPAYEVLGVFTRPDR